MNGIDSLNIIHNVTRKYDVSSLYEDENRISVYERDCFGFRGSFNNVSDIDILTIGGSTTDQRYITEGKTWQDVLSIQFADRGKAIAIANAGVDGQTSYGHVRNFREWFPLIGSLHAKHYLFYVGFNDVNDGENGKFDRNPFKPKSSTTSRENAASHEVIKVGHVIRRHDDANKVTSPKLENHVEHMKGHLDRYERNLHLLADAVKERGGAIIFVTQSSLLTKSVGQDEYEYGGHVVGLPGCTQYHGFEINALDRSLMRDVLNQRTREVCKEVDGILIDLGKELQWEDDDFYDCVHNTPQGARKVGEYLFHELENIM